LVKNVYLGLTIGSVSRLIYYRFGERKDSDFFHILQKNRRKYVVKHKFPAILYKIIVKRATKNELLSNYSVKFCTANAPE